MTGTGNKAAGGEFLLTGPRFETPNPDTFDDARLSLREGARLSVRKNVLPLRGRLEAHDYESLASALKSFADDGFLGAEIPEEYGGAGLGLIESALIAEGIGMSGDASFGVTVGAHAGIGCWPVMLFGNDEQRRKYLPRFADASMPAAYCLTEPSSGSDALSAKLKAEPTADGTGYVLNGEKMFISNAGIARLFTVFAKVNGRPAVFLVEGDAAGVTIGKEEHKMGLWGSSTCSVSFQDVLVPKENLVGESGKGHKIVMNTLNLGRFKLGAGCLGAMKYALRMSVRYAAERRQFGRPIIEFDAIRAKIADMAADIWVGEAMVYRLAGLLETAESVEEFEVECAIVKTALSEMLWRAANTAVQIHGGLGYILEGEDNPARLLLDSRINLIFEGTNEINRLHVVGTLLKRAMSGRLDIGFTPAPGWTERDDWEGKASSLVDAAKLSTQFALRQSGARLGAAYVMAAAGDLKKAQAEMMAKEQRILFAIADMCMLTYALDAAEWRGRSAASETFGFAASDELFRLHHLVAPHVFRGPDASHFGAEKMAREFFLSRPSAAAFIRYPQAAADQAIKEILG